MTIPAEVYKLVERFDYNLADYKSGKYNETQVRREFIDPFFKALGWDIDNEKGYAEAYKDVVHEDAIKVGRATKAPDYSFRIGGVRKFFLEAKKPSVDIKHDTHPAYQLRRYAWSAKLPLSILTDFEEFAVYDGRIKPVKTDKAANARLMYLTYDQYIDRWQELADTFSPEAIRRGAFDKFAESTKAKKGTAEVDDAFLQEIERWRDTLARNLALRNNLTQRELNFAVQLTIDRLIFLRIAEDRGIEPYGQLRDVGKQANVYRQLLTLFRRADDRYNSGLFHFQAEKGRADPDELTPHLSLDDKVLQDIFKNLYYPDSPYEFSVLPADILGQVYEQFLGKVIRLTAGGRARVEDKPEVKKTGGVFYTPTYIVDYIVKQTVGPLVEGQTPDKLRGKNPLRILDPACGSGSFLLGAYQFLLDWSREQYLSDDKGPERWLKSRPPRLYQTDSGEWKLTTEERKNILVTHIFGVDIDPQAVEVTKLSLLLKVLEGEDEKGLQPAFAGFGERILPDLGDNIKCGNSLIGPDFYDSQPAQMSMFAEDEFYRINAFDWQAEFAEIMQDGGFDAIIGNPPYIKIQALKEWTPLEVEFYKEQYRAASKGNYDIYVVFLEQGLNLLNEKGRLGFILPHKFFQAQFGKHIRQILAEKKAITEVVDFGAEQVFSNATTYTCILILTRLAQDQFRYIAIKNLENPSNLLAAIQTGIPSLNYKESSNVHPRTDEQWNFFADNENVVFDKISQQPLTLGDITRKIFVGLQTSADKIYALRIIEYKEHRVLCYSQALDKEIEIEKAFVKPFLMGRDVHRYEPPNPEYVVIFPYEARDNKAVLLSKEFIQENYPNGWQYLLAYNEGIE